jgi:hypothetical protein
LSGTAVENGLKYYEGEVVRLEAGTQLSLNLEYDKSSDILVAPSQGIQPSAPVDEDTPGRISLNNSLPYVIGGAGVLLIVGGFVYYLQSGQGAKKKGRRRAHSQTPSDEEGNDSYCPQCGSRAKAGDRFCRVCGARLRRPEE